MTVFKVEILNRPEDWREVEIEPGGYVSLSGHQGAEAIRVSSLSDKKSPSLPASLSWAAWRRRLMKERRKIDVQS